MGQGRTWPWATVGLLAALPPAWGQSIFAHGFEASCLLDADGDRLVDCVESARITDAHDSDTDDDGISDGDEVLGTLGGLDLPALGVDPRRKDILLEYDWFDDASEAGTGDTCPAGAVHSHRPTAAMLEVVTTMFAQAPVANPDGTTGIHVIHDIGQGGPFTGGNLVAEPDGIVVGHASDDESLGHFSTNFDQARRGYFHYVLMAHRYVLPNNDGSSGSATIESDRMMVTLNCRATTRNVGRTIAHELGHNLGLHHGGGTTCNGKPNYNSIMNYRFQFRGIDTTCDALGDLVADYSRGLRAPLDENALMETSGVCAFKPLDWNKDGSIQASPMAQDVNNWNSFEILEADQPVRCGGMLTVLADFDDWSAIDLALPAPGGGGAQVTAVSPPCPNAPP